MSKYWSKLCCLKGWVGHFERKFQGEGGRPLTNFGVRKLESLGYHVVLIQRLAVLLQYRRVSQTDRHTDRHTMMAITRALPAPRG